jgi:hypothetical protein
VEMHEMTNKLSSIVVILTETEKEMMRDDAKRVIFSECISKFMTTQTLESFYLLCTKEVKRNKQRKK